MTDRIGRAVIMGFHVAIATLVAACQLSPGVACDDGWCPIGMRCALALDGNEMGVVQQLMCVMPNTCGNGIPETGEVCDDGNTRDGDGCSHDCMSKEICGNGIIDTAVGESCDDGNRINGDSCEADCTLPRCGNGILDRDEECDDHNLSNGDTCESDCTMPRCGNGIKDLDEECDDGNAVDGDGCELNCRLPTCGNGIMDKDEECDDRNASNGDGCSASCRVEFCRDGRTNDNEVCDPTDPAFGFARCNFDCTLSECGDGKINFFAFEECDDGSTSDGDGCSHDCKREFCGDGKTNNQEPCDPTDPRFGPEACNFDCTPTRCGDHKLNIDAHEQCDDGNEVSGDGCSRDCKLEHCGNGSVDAGEDCDGGAGPQPCSAICRQEICGNGIRDNDPAHGVVEECDDGNLNDGDGCSHDCKFEFRL